MSEFLQWLSFSPFATVSATFFYLIAIAYCASAPARRKVQQLLSHPTPSTNQQFDALDSYRGLAAALVAMSHMWQWPMPIFNATQTQWWWFLSFGSKAVAIFSVLSGFLIFRSLKKSETFTDLHSYFKRRFLRVYPLYFVTVIAGFALLQAKLTPANVVGEFFMLRSLGFSTFTNPAAWSLYVEVLFYLLLPAWVILFRRRPLTSSVVCFAIFLLADSFSSREFWLWKYFFAGIIASEIADRLKGRLNEISGFAIFIAGVVLLRIDFLRDPYGALGDWFSWLHVVPKIHHRPRHRVYSYSGRNASFQNRHPGNGRQTIGDARDDFLQLVPHPSLLFARAFSRSGFFRSRHASAAEKLKSGCARLFPSVCRISRSYLVGNAQLYLDRASLSSSSPPMTPLRRSHSPVLLLSNGD